MSVEKLQDRLAYPPRALRADRAASGAMSKSKFLKFVDQGRLPRHGRRRYFFRAHGKKYPLTGKPGDPEFHAAYARFLADFKANTLAKLHLSKGQSIG